jgi:uncharacterized protein DUF1553/uncharacterized protein DUF1549/cytochrome c
MRTNLLTALAAMVALAPAAGARADDAGIEFFEKKIRPVLVENCFKCHSQQAGKQKGGLALDSRAAIRKGGESGPAIVPGKPDESLLIKAVRQTSPDLKMPPKGKLPDAIVADLARWIAMGAPDPRTAGGPKIGTVDAEAARRHWAFQPIRSPQRPAVKHAGWARTPIDLFLQARLEARGLTPSPPADRRTLIRRAYFDLIGVPPTFEETEAFVHDPSPDAFAAVVDRLLASPRYGERWGRHWLDVARYADTKDGVLMYGDDRIRPYAYTYRDYVVRAFNEDTPFDRFVHEQLAADQLPVEPWRLAAMGFLTLGRMFDNNIHDVLDDRIDVVTRGFLGLTVSCARCHDHKYDPVPMADYYSLYSIFASCEAPLELPLISPARGPQGEVEFEKQAAPKRQEIRALQEKQFAILSEAVRQRAGDYLVRAATTQPDPLETAIFFLSLAPEDLRPQIVNRWRRFLAHPARIQDPVFAPWQDFMKCPDADFAARAAEVCRRWLAHPQGLEKGRLNPLLHQALRSARPSSKGDVARIYGKLLADVYARSKKGGSMSPAEKQVLDVLTSKESPCYFPKSQTYYYMSRQEKDAFGGMMVALDRMAVKSPFAPPRAMVLHDSPELYEPRIFTRGNPSRPGERVPRQFLRVLAGDRPRPFVHGSGRLDLARAITDPSNPLTARVLVNRVWMYHFGEPLVSTPSDFGFRSTPPAQPELLDWLADTFQKQGWSLKKLHRTIMLSSAYQQASFDQPEARQIDPDNLLLWRFNRQRLDLEAMRDALLAVAGRLDPKMGGRPVDIVNDFRNGRRTVYGLVDRQSLPGLFRAFDFANPDQSAERRPMTTVPQQALFDMNSPFVVEQARAIAARVPGHGDSASAIAGLYHLVLGRQPTAAETSAGERFLRAAFAEQNQSHHSQLKPLEQYAQVLLMTNEFLFVD